MEEYNGPPWPPSNAWHTQTVGALALAPNALRCVVWVSMEVPISRIAKCQFVQFAIRRFRAMQRWYRTHVIHVGCSTYRSMHLIM